MAAATAPRAPARKSGGVRGLPVITVARFEEATRLIEQLVAENTDAFIQAGQQYRDRHRAGTRRPLDATEVASIAAGLGTHLADAQAQIEDAGLTHHDEPQPQELLLAAGVATAPAFVQSALRFVALIELDPVVFENACEAGTLDQAIGDAVAELRRLPLADARQRASEALAHLATNAGVEPGKARRLITGPVMQALEQAMIHLTSLQSGSVHGSSTSSPASTDGPAGPSSTTPPGGTPAS